MRKITLLTIVFTVVLLLNSFAQKGFVNPAAKYCEILGYKYEITSVKGVGDVGMVSLPDGKLVNAWDFYKGKIGQEYSYAAKHGYTVVTETSKVNGYTVESPICIRVVKGVQERIALNDLMEKNGDFLYVADKNMIDFHDIAQEDPNFKSATVIPTSFDWRSYNGHSYIGSPRDQGSCGSCYAFGATACAEGTYNFATGKYDGNTSDFAEAYIAWCLSTLPAYTGHFSGCNGADYDYQELQALVDVGTIPESYFPYTTTATQTCPSSTSSAPKTKFLGWYRVACSDIDAIKTAIMTYGVVDAAVYVSTAFQNYTGGVFSDASTSCNGSPCANTTTNHAISLVGWGHDATYGDYWILRNSWGSSWGESGYMRLAVTSARVACSVCYMTYQGSTTPTAPTASTVSASGLSVSGATLNGTVNNNNATSTTVTFDYGTTTSYGSSKTATPSSVTGSTSTSVAATLTGLTANTTYHFRVKAVNSVGTTYGSDMTFVTTSNPTTVNLPLTENFAASTIPTGWSTINTGTGITERWSVSNTANAGGTAYEMKCSYQNLNPGTTMLVTPGINTTGLSTMVLNAKYMLDDYGAGATIKIQKSNDKTTWTDVSGWSLTTTANTNRTGSITNLSIPVSGAATYIAFVITGNLYQIDYFYLDNVSITGPTSATAPTATTVAATLITNSGATLNATVNNNNAASTTVTFEYGTTTSYGSTITASSVTGNTNTSVSAAITGLAANTLYHYRVKAVNSVGTTYGSDLTFTTTGSIVYCASKGTSFADEWIAKVQLGSFTKTSTGSSYSDYTSSVIPVVVGNNTVTLTPGFTSTTYTEYFRVWIDFNKDGDFTDTGEQVYAPAGGKVAVTGTITIPSTFSGQTRMRVSMKYNAAPTACETFSYGEVEDYTVSIAKTAILQDNNITLNVFPNPANNKLYVQSSELDSDMSIYNAMGALVIKKQISNVTEELNISNFANGIYTICITKGNRIQTKKFIKN